MGVFLSSVGVGAAPQLGGLGVSCPCEREGLQELPPSSPGSQKLLPCKEEHVPGGRSLSTPSGWRERLHYPYLPTTEVRLLTFGTSLLTANTKFSMMHDSQVMGVPMTPLVHLKVLNQKNPKTLWSWGLPWQWEPGRVFWPEQAGGSSSKTPWVPN